MLKRLATLSRPCVFRALHVKPLLPYSNNPNRSSSQEWRNFPFIPFLSANTKLGLFLGIPAIAGYLIPHEPIFDVAGAALALATIPADKKYFSMNPYGPPEKLYGRELTSKLVSQSAYAISCLLSFGALGENYLISSLFTVFGYLAFMGAYRLATQFIPPENLTKSQLIAYGSILSSAVMYTFTDLSDIADFPVMDLTRFMIPVYLGCTYLAGTKIVNVFEDATRAMMAQPVDPKNLEGDRMQGVLNELDSWKIEYHMTRFLILYKWINISAYIIFLCVIALGKAFGVKSSPEYPRDPKHQDPFRDDYRHPKRD